MSLVADNVKQKEAIDEPLMKLVSSFIQGKEQQVKVGKRNNRY